MRVLHLTATTLAITALLCPLQSQNLADRVSASRADILRISFPTRPEICGDGKSIGETTVDGFVTHTYWSGGYSTDVQRFWQLDCRRGPMRLVVEREGGRVTELRAAVGVGWLPDAPGVDLGTFSGAEAATWLLDIAETNQDVASAALLAANTAENAPLADRLFTMARDGTLHPDVRQRAIRWVNSAAGREGLQGRADRLLRELVSARTENVDIRERAIRSLRETDENDDWLRDQYAAVEWTQLQERIIRRIGASPSAANAAWIRSVALDTNEPLELRERALRVIGEQTPGHDEIRTLYDRLDRPALRERALRVVGDNASAEDLRWIREVAADESEMPSVRDRAIRMLGEGADLATMRQLYREIDRNALRERVLRMVGERLSADGAAWLEEVARDGTETVELRDRAIHLLGDYEPTAVRDLFESLDRDGLRDRALRVASQRGDRGTTEWLTGIATGTRYSTQIRDRALRLLGERVLETNELAALYGAVDGTDLRRRVIRLLADRGDDAAVEELRAIAETDSNRELRRYALRRLGEIR